MFELFFEAAWKVLVAGLVLGAGIPALFALGVRFSASGAGGEAVALPSARAKPLHSAIGATCFVVAALAVALGITVVVASGFGKMISFEQGFPTLVDKA
jgi:hypothetical protein